MNKRESLGVYLSLFLIIAVVAGAGVPAEKISFARDTFTFNYPIIAPRGALRACLKSPGIPRRVG